ncbi:MAG: hypothetical protein EOP48_19215 [Sphingobacteriales bacterium]|nr:MAG: hypothetical protein EOP48_19215 [Sphingobacteriales bacterium]
MDRSGMFYFKVFDMSDKNAFVQQSYVVDQLISPTERFPNNEKLPLLIYKKALLLHPDDMEEKVIGLLKENGYENSWVGDVYDHDHFHTNTHEILVIFSGNAEIVFGGDAAKCQEVNRGDVAPRQQDNTNTRRS